MVRFSCVNLIFSAFFNLYFLFNEIFLLSEVKDRKETISFDIGNTLMARAQTSHPLDPLSVAEISVAVATVRAAGKTPEVH